jgi:hypothetical protein
MTQETQQNQDTSLTPMQERESATTLTTSMLRPGTPQDFYPLVKDAPGAKLDCGLLIGIATGIERRAGSLPNGEVSESLFLTGKFELTNLFTGEIYRGAQAILPRSGGLLVEQAFKGSVEGARVLINCSLRAKLDPKSPTGYRWTAAEMREDDDDVMDELRREQRQFLMAKGRQALLGAPQTAPGDFDAGGHLIPSKAAE